MVHHWRKLSSNGSIGQQFDPSSQIRYDTPWPADTNLYMSNYNFIPYVQAPKSAHVLWKQQGAISGIIGGKEGVYSALSGGVNPTIVFAGRAYATYSKPGVGTTTQTYWQCYDLRTGTALLGKTIGSG